MRLVDAACKSNLERLWIQHKQVSVKAVHLAKMKHAICSVLRSFTGLIVRDVDFIW